MTHAGGCEHVGVVEQVESTDDVKAASHIVEPAVEFVAGKGLLGTQQRLTCQIGGFDVCFVGKGTVKARQNTPDILLLEFD